MKPTFNFNPNDALRSRNAPNPRDDFLQPQSTPRSYRMKSAQNNPHKADLVSQDHAEAKVTHTADSQQEQRDQRWVDPILPRAYAPKQAKEYVRNGNNMGKKHHKPKKNKTAQKEQTVSGQPTHNTGSKDPMQNMWMNQRQQWQAWKEAYENGTAEDPAMTMRTNQVQGALSNPVMATSHSSTSHQGKTRPVHLPMAGVANRNAAAMNMRANQVQGRWPNQTSAGPTDNTSTSDQVDNQPTTKSTTKNDKLSDYLNTAMEPVLGNNKVPGRLMAYRHPDTGMYKKSMTNEDPNPCKKELEALLSCFINNDTSRTTMYTRNNLADCVLENTWYFYKNGKK